VAADDRIVSPASGAAFSLRSGERFQIIDIEGSQVSDLVVFRAEDPTERFSPGNTRKLNNSLLLTTSDILYSTKCHPLLEIVEDTVGRHDLQSSACSPYDYPIRFGISDHPSCLAILVENLSAYDIPEYLIPEPFNVFMKSQIDGQTGEIRIEEGPSRAGDHIVFEALVDCIVGLTCCPQDQNDCNGRKITPLRVAPA
jgi:uncharacterized protein YcgI (DUF1989 family)